MGTDVTDKFTDEERTKLTTQLMHLHMIYISMCHRPARIEVIDAAAIKKETDTFCSMYPVCHFWPGRFTEAEKVVYLAEEVARLRKDADLMEALLKGRLVQWNKDELGNNKAK